MKRILAILLALTLCLGMLPLAVSADETGVGGGSPPPENTAQTGSDGKLDERIAANEAFLAQWINPGQLIGPQSETIVAKANEITAGLTSDYEKTKAIAAWVSENIEYDYDVYYRRVTRHEEITAENVLKNRIAVCTGYAILTEALLQAAGIPAAFVSGAANGLGGWPTEGQSNHGWNLAFADGRWIWIDTTWGMWYFDMKTETFSQTHKVMRGWTSGRSLYPDSKDIPSDWAKTEVWEAICKGLVPYDLQTDYRSGITRQEFCRLMVTLVEHASGQNVDDYLGIRGKTVSAPFTDTADHAVWAAYTLGIVNGTSATTFNPGGAITRQEAATMLARTGKLIYARTGDSETFADADRFAAWAAESIDFVSGLTDPETGGKVMGGTGNGNFSPTDLYTREQAILTSLRLIHGVLWLYDFRYEFTAGGPEAEWNPGCIGSFGLSFMVGGPSTVAHVKGLYPRETMPTYEEIEKILADIDESKNIGKMTYVPLPHPGGVGSKPVFPEMIGKTMYIIVYGFDMDANIVAHTVIPVKVTIDG